MSTTGTTGQKCQQSGKYQCTQHSDSVIYLSNGETFTPCSKYLHGAAWVMIGAHGEFNKRGAGYLNTEVESFREIFTEGFKDLRIGLNFFIFQISLPVNKIWYCIKKIVLKIFNTQITSPLWYSPRSHAKQYMHSEGGAFKMSTTVKTGEICEKSGEYQCISHPSEVYSFSKGKKVPPCGKYDHDTTWIWIGPKN